MGHKVTRLYLAEKDRQPLMRYIYRHLTDESGLVTVRDELVLLLSTQPARRRCVDQPRVMRLSLRGTVLKCTNVGNNQVRARVYCPAAKAYVASVAPGESGEHCLLVHDSPRLSERASQRLVPA